MQSEFTRWSQVGVICLGLSGFLNCAIGQDSAALREAPADATPPRHDYSQSGALPRFWIGIQAQPLDDAFKSHLDLEHGVMVGDVPTDSPADKAGVRRHDILLEIDGRDIHEVTDILSAIADANGAAVELKLLREGREESLKIQPQERPPVPTPSDRDEATRANRLFNWTWPRYAEGPNRILLYDRSPDLSVVEALRFQMQLPDDVSITIKRQGKNPAAIDVQRGDEEWHVQEGELDKLPVDLRPQVEAMLQPGPVTRVGPDGMLELRPRLRGWSGGPILAPHAPMAPDAAPYTVPGTLVPGSDPNDKDLREELNQLKEQIQKLQETVDKLPQQ